MNEQNYMPDARQLAAQCWCDDETKGRVMDPALAEAIAKRIATWMATAAQHMANEEYYRGLVQRCGAVFGVAAHICDDGSHSQDILCAKVPELVEELARRAYTTIHNPNFWQRLEDARLTGLESHHKMEALLRSCGWKHTSETPDCCWRWQKQLPDGRIMLLSMEDALCIEESLQPAEATPEE